MTIKKILVAGLAGTVLAGAANAMEPSYYAGGELSFGKRSYKEAFKTAAANADLKKKSHGLGLFVGAKFHENFGAEAGYTFRGKTKASEAAGNKRTIKGDSMHIDAVGFLPVADKTNVLGTIGLGWTKTKVSEGATAAINTSKSKTGLRLGIGAQYDINETVAGRVMLRQQKVGGDVQKSINSFGAAIVWNFM